MSEQGHTLPEESGSPSPRRSVRLTAFDEVCPYLKDRVATLEGFFAGDLDSELYRRLMDVGFRRSGRFFYHAACQDCRKCVPIRVPVDGFKPSKSQRRCWRENQDLRVEVGAPELTAEKYELYCRYLLEKHADSSEKTMGAVYDFLYNPVVSSIEFCYRDFQGKLVAAGICDVFGDALSSVYCYYDPAEKRRGLGTFTALNEIEYCRKRALAYYYLGFLVRECQAMAYKVMYRPHETLDSSRGWVNSEE
jgi:leucyl-tRNA---protein transferase